MLPQATRRKVQVKILFFTWDRIETSDCVGKE